MRPELYRQIPQAFGEGRGTVCRAKCRYVVMLRVISRVSRLTNARISFHWRRDDELWREIAADEHCRVISFVVLVYIHPNVASAAMHTPHALQLPTE